MKVSVIPATLLVLCSVAFAGNTWYVPDDFTTIQDAINAASSGDTIVVRPGTYVENLLVDGKTLTLMSDEGPSSTIIDGNSQGATVSFVNNVGAGTTINGFTIRNGSGRNYNGAICGGGIFSDPSCIVAIEDNVITDNTIDGYECYGAGIYCHNATIVDNLINHNEIYWMSDECQGGGVYCNNSTVEFNRIINNDCGGIQTSGGGIYCRESTVRFNVVKENGVSDDGNGGGVSAYDSEITGNIISSNGGSYGGGLSCGSDSTITSNLIFGNYADGGGGIFCGGLPGPTIENNVIVGNRAGYGGGIYVYFSASGASIINSTVCHNFAIDDGGGISGTAETRIINSIVWENSALTSDPEIAGSPYVAFSDVKGGWPGPGNIDADPSFVSPGYWDDNGTPGDPYDDFWVHGDGDYHLTWPSPCRNTGDNLAVTETEDFEGDPRISGGAVDMGADEYHYHLYLTGDPVPSGSVTFKVVGVPGINPVKIYRGSLRTTPLSTQYGMLFIKKPWLHILDVGPVPADGIATTSRIIPSGILPGSEFYFQALHGPLGIPNTELTNLLTLTVE